jgi:hypothetical protein
MGSKSAYETVRKWMIEADCGRASRNGWETCMFGGLVEALNGLYALISMDPYQSAGSEVRNGTATGYPPRRSLFRLLGPWPG